MEDQITIFKYLIKNFYATQVFYEFIRKNQKFFKLNKTLPYLNPKDLLDIKKKDLDVLNVHKIKKNKKIELSDSGSNEENSHDEDECDGLKINQVCSDENFKSILNENYNQKTIKNHFDFLFSNYSISKFIIILNLDPIRKQTFSKILIERLSDYKFSNKDRREKSIKKYINCKTDQIDN